MTHPVCVYLGDALAAYNFGASHAFGPQRHTAFTNAFYAQALDKQVDVLSPVLGNVDQLRCFHTPEYIDKVRSLSQQGHGMLDCGDTPVFAGMYEAALTVVGTTLDAVHRVMQGEYQRAFIPIAGLHHARRDTAAGFCIFNDCAIAIEQLHHHFGVERVAYIDIDAHHGDGVYYSFDEDPGLCFVDIHEDGRFLYPGTGSAGERGRGPGKGNKLNIPMPPYANDAQFMQVWQDVEELVRREKPGFILLQSGADSLRGDPLTHLHYSKQAHVHAAACLSRLADEVCEGRLVVMGGGGYNLDNIAGGWTAVVTSLVSQTPDLATQRGEEATVHK